MDLRSDQGSAIRCASHFIGQMKLDPNTLIGYPPPEPTGKTSSGMPGSYQDHNANPWPHLTIRTGTVE